MNRLWIVVWSCLLPWPALAGAGQGGPAEARRLLLSGKYAEAAEIYQPLADKDPAAALGLARCLAAEGKHDPAVKTLKSSAGRHAGLHAELARLAFEAGDYPAAKSAADEAARLEADQPLARWVLAELDRAAGRLDEAQRGYRRLIRYYNDHEIKDAEPLRWIGLAAAQYARWNRLADQFHFLVNELYPDALKLDPAYWPAHYEAGLLFLEKYNQADAKREFQAALALNPRAAEVHAAMAMIALADRDLEQAQASARRAREINPRLLDAWLIEADLLWGNFQVAETLKLLEEKIRPLNPKSPETLGRLAACYVLLDGLPKPDEQSRLSRLIAEVTQGNPRPGEFYHVLAAALESRNKQPEAERYFQEAGRAMPQLIGPKAELGMLYMRWGREAEAAKLLKGAFDDDPFNVRVNNTLDVLEVLDAMQAHEGRRFTLKYDGKLDNLLARYAVRHLEKIYPELCQRFGYEPPGKTMVEVFNEARGLSGHQWFSARMIGLPYLGTVAASTGRIVAMVSPGDRQVSHRFQWARVLTHELVHVVTIQQTDFNIPHWFTEGLAVSCEGYPRPQEWNELLVDRVASGKLFNLRTINPAFSRPKSSADWQMAYCQSLLYVEFIQASFGPEAVRKLLAAYTAGKTTPEAIRQSFGVSEDEFEGRYLAYLKKLVAGMPALERPDRREFADLLAASQREPVDADTLAELAYAYLRRQAKREALDAAERAMKLRQRHPLATYVAARLEVEAGRTGEAIAMLEKSLDLKAPEPMALNLLAGLKLKTQQFDEAERLYVLGERLDAINLKWTRALARLYLQTGNQARLAEALARLARADADDLNPRKKLAQMALARRAYAEAAEWANQGLQIDVLDAEVHRMLAEALSGTGQFTAAIEEFETAVELDPKNPQPRFALADACLQAKQPAKARQALQGLLKLVPDYPGAKLLLETIKEKDQP